MSRKGYGGLYKAQTMEERRKRTAKRRERDKIKFIDLRFERWQVVGRTQNSGKQEEGKTFHKLHVLGMNDGLRERVRDMQSCRINQKTTRNDMALLDELNSPRYIPFNNSHSFGQNFTSFRSFAAKSQSRRRITG